VQFGIQAAETTGTEVELRQDAAMPKREDFGHVYTPNFDESLALL
jgi:hypothetical protein